MDPCNPTAIERVAGPALERARSQADCIVIDEVAPMQRHSERFLTETHRCLAERTPLIGAVAQGDPLLETACHRPDVARWPVTHETRDGLPAALAAWISDLTR